MSKAFNAKQIIDDLETKETSVQLKALSLLSTLTAVSNVPVEVLNAVVHLLKTTENKLVLNTVLVAVRHLATFERTKMMFGDSTAVQEALLIHVEKFNSPNLQYSAVEALVNITSGYEPNQIQLMSFASKLIIPIVGIIQREGERTRKLACKLMDQLVASEKCVEILCQETQRIVKRVDIEELKREAERERKRMMEMEGDGEEEEQAPAIEEPEEEFFEQNFLEPLIICLQVNDRAVQEWTTDFFWRIAGHRNGFYCKFLAEVAIVEPLIKLLSQSLDSLPLMTNVLKILNNITDAHDLCRQWAGESNSGKILCSVIRKNTPGLNREVSIAYSQTPAVRTLIALAMKLLVNITQSKLEQEAGNKMDNPTKDQSSTINLQSGYLENSDPANVKAVQIEIVKEGGLKVLYQYIRPIQYGGSGDDESDHASKKYTQQLQEHAVRIVANISKIEENAVRVLSMKAPPINEKLLKEMKERLEEERRIERGEPKEEPKQENVPEAVDGIPKMENGPKAPPPPVPSKPSDRTLSTRDEAPPSLDVETLISSPDDDTHQVSSSAMENVTSKPPPPPVPSKPLDRTVSTREEEPISPNVETDQTPVIPVEEEYRADAPSLVELLIDLLVEKRDTNNLKKNVIEAMSNFTRHDDCVLRLVQMGIIERLLDLIRNRTEILVIADLFSRMNEHTSFQKLLHQNKGLRPLIELLKSRHDDEIESGLRAVGPYVYTPSGRIILQREGVFKLVREHMRHGGVIGKMAKKIMKVLKQEGIQATSAGAGGQMVTMIVNGEEQTVFVEFDWDEAHRIDRDLVAPAMKHLQELTKKYRFKLTINWRAMERTPQHLGLLARESVYDDLVIAIEQLLGSDSNTIHTFNSQIQMIVIEISESDTNVIEVNDLVMRYKLCADGSILPPKQICKILSEDILGYDITEFDDLFNDDDQFDEEYVQGIESLKRCATDNRIPMIGDVNLLYFHLETSDQLYKPTFVQSQVIEACRVVIDDDELLIKAWPIVKYNKKGFKQERLLMLTNMSYYTVAFDAKNRRIDYKHCKIHNLEDYYLIDVGNFVGNVITTPSRESMKRDSINNDANGQHEMYAMNMVTNEKPHKGHAASSESNDDDDQDDDGNDDDLMSAMDQDQDDDADLTSALQAEQELMNLNGEIVTTQGEGGVRIMRPSTKGKYCSIIVAPSDIKPNKQKQYLQEIAWCFFAAASAVRRGEIYQPFECAVKKPKISFMSKIGNKFGAGVGGNFQKAGHSKILSKLQNEKEKERQNAANNTVRERTPQQSEEINKNRKSLRDLLSRSNSTTPTGDNSAKKDSFGNKSPVSPAPSSGAVTKQNSSGSVVGFKK